MATVNNLKQNLNDGMKYIGLLIENKDKIIEGLEELSLEVRGHKDLFDYRVNSIYEYLEDEFSPSIKLIKSQIDEGKLSKKKYKILLEDTNYGNREDIFSNLLNPIEKLVTAQSDIMYEVMNNNKIAHFGYNKLYDWFHMLITIIPAIEDIIRYGINEDINNDKYYYFEWYKNHEENSQQAVYIFKKEFKNYSFIIYHNGDFQINDITYKFDDLDANEKNGIFFLFSFLEVGEKKSPLIYKDEFIKQRTERFLAMRRKTTVKDETFNTYTQRWNSFAEKNNIKLFFSINEGMIYSTENRPKQRRFNPNFL